MSRPQLETDVLVVGAGPTGYTLALLLARAGVEVTLVERWKSVYPLPRAVAISHESLRTLAGVGFDRFDLLQSWSDAGRTFTFSDAKGDTLLSTVYPSTSLSGYAPMYAFAQPALEAELARLVDDEPGVCVLRAESVFALEQDSDGVTVRTREHDGLAEVEDGRAATFRARYVAGCDGANSTVRALLGLELRDMEFAHDWFVVDVRLDDQSEFVPYGRQHLDPARPTTLISGGPQLRRWEFMIRPEESRAEFSTDDAAWKLLAPWGVRADNAEIVRHATYSFAARWLDRWHDGRVAVAGDAAHQTPPFLGQGFNSGIRDAANLAWRLRFLLAQGHRDQVLHDYSLERSGQFQQILAETVAAGRMICMTDPELAARRDARLVRRAGEDRPARTEWPISGGTQGIHPRSGQLAPQVSVEMAGREGAADRLAPGQFLLVVSSSCPAAIVGDKTVEDLAALGGQLWRIGVEIEDPDGGYQRWLDELGAHAALIRPDHYLFDAESGPDAPDELVARLSAALKSQTSGERNGAIAHQEGIQ